MAGQEPAKPVSLFYSYSHRDEDLRLRLETHLAVLRRGGLIAEWHDRKLEPGDAWKGEIDRHLGSADIVLLLVSADFFASDYCWGEEMTKALTRHERGEALVIPVILRYCGWQDTPLGALQAVPRDARPINAWPDQDEAFTEVVAAIKGAVAKVRQKASPSRMSSPDEPPVSVPAPAPPARRRRPSIQPGTVVTAAPTQRPEALEPGAVFRDVEAPWCPEMVVIPAGSFMMGSPEGEADREDAEGPQHEVRFAQPFALGRYPLTFVEYDHFCAETRRQKADDNGWGRDRRPVINVSWEDAEAYCKWLSDQTGQPYRLPGEAEWEYACRAGTTTPFWTGPTISTEQANYDGNYTYGGGQKGEYRDQTTPVDAFLPNPWGLYDMHGNVWEWLEDCWNETYEGAPTGGSAWTSGDCSQRVLRGGSWDVEPGVLRSAGRVRDGAGSRNDNGGFRVARTLR